MRVPNGPKPWIEIHKRLCVCVCTFALTLFWAKFRGVCFEANLKSDLLLRRSCWYKKAPLTVGRERLRHTESEGAGGIYFWMYFRKVLIIMTSPPWIWAPAEVTNVQRCQFVWDYASRAPRVEVDTWGGQECVLLKSGRARERAKSEDRELLRVYWGGSRDTDCMHH